MCKDKCSTRLENERLKSVTDEAIAKAIKETLVVQNPESIKYAVAKIKNLYQ